MTRIHGSSSEKTHSLMKIQSLFAEEAKNHIFAFSLFVTLWELKSLFSVEMPDLQRESFVISCVIFFFLYCVIEKIFRLFTGDKLSVAFSLLLSIPVFMILNNDSLMGFSAVAVVFAALIRLFMICISKNRIIFAVCVVITDVASLLLFFFNSSYRGNDLIDRLLFVFLVTLTLSVISELYTFYYFIVLCIVLAFIPVSSKPIDWSYVVKAMEDFSEGVVKATEDISYYISHYFNEDTYTAGYSGLKVAGNKLEESDVTQLILKMNEAPFYRYTDDETDEKMKVRRAVYLVGGRGTDKKQLVDLLLFLHNNSMSREDALVFSRLSDLEIEYAYLDTADVIAPDHSIALYSSGEKLDTGVSEHKHGKGYKIKAYYIDVDMGSPYLTGMFTNTDTNDVSSDVSYSDICDMFKEIYGLSLREFLSEQEYDHYKNIEISEEYLESEGVSERLKELANKLTEGAASDYEKSRVIEAYLRQYPYDTNISGEGFDMGIAEDMAQAADRFLFEAGRGFCVHYTSAMVMLLRESGIPARAVTGFRYAFPFDEADHYEVSSSCAHAWPEAYIKNVGWVPFEPTGAYLTAEDYSWRRKKADAPQTYKEKSEDLHVPEIEVAIEDAETEAESPVILNIVLTVGIITVALLILLIVIFILVRKLRYVYGSSFVKLKTDVDMIKKCLLKKNKKTFTDRGLLTDYVLLAPKDFRTEINDVFMIYYRAVYGNEADREISSEESEKAKTVRKLLIKRRGMIK